MESLILKNFRCFRDLDISTNKRITLLVGENSTGKSTFLAGLRSSWDICQGRTQGGRLQMARQAQTMVLATVHLSPGL